MLRNAMNRVKNVFQRIVEREQLNDVLLGMPSTDQAHRDRRMNAMSMMTGGRGFKIPKKEIRRYSDGTTRGERKRTARALANARILAERDYEAMRSSLRSRLHVDPSLQVAA